MVKDSALTPVDLNLLCSPDDGMLWANHLSSLYLSFLFCIKGMKDLSTDNVVRTDVALLLEQSVQVL